MATSPPPPGGSPPPPKDYQQLYLNVRNKPLVVHDVTVKGNDRTKPGVFDKVLAPIYAAQSLDELRIRCLEANAILNSYAIFDRVDILCDAGPANAPDSASVVVEVTEKNKVNLHGGAYVSQSGEGSAEFSAGLNNALGYGEKLDVEMLQGHEKSSTYGLAWAQPRVFNNDVDVTTRVFQQGACWAFPKSQHCLLPLFECTTRDVCSIASASNNIPVLETLTNISQVHCLPIQHTHTPYIAQTGLTLFFYTYRCSRA